MKRKIYQNEVRSNVLNDKANRTEFVFCCFFFYQIHNLTETKYLNTVIYWTTIQRHNPGGAKYHDYPLGLNVDLNTTDNTKLHINTQSHFTFDTMVK